MMRLYWSIPFLALLSTSLLMPSYGFASQPRGAAIIDPSSSRGIIMLVSTPPPPRFENTLMDARGKALYSEKSLGKNGSGGVVDTISFQTLAYVLTSLAYATIAAIIVFMPDQTNTVLLERKLGGACGFGLAAGLSNILAVASSRHRLEQGQEGVEAYYKKLNLGLVAFCAVGLLAVPGESAFTPWTIPATLLAGFMSMVRVVGGLTAYCGWRAGVKKNKNVVQELAEGVQSTKESLDLDKSHKGWFYKYSTVFVAFAVLTNLMLIGRSRLDFDISLAVSAMARLCLVASMLLTLKDANDREQLSGKTFVQMNFMLAAWAFIGTYALV
jgi:hypothetical protein